jgi:hypothetical protein
VIVSVNLFLGLSALFTYVQCRPIARLWDSTVPGSCWPSKVIVTYNSFSSGKKRTVWHDYAPASCFNISPSLTMPNHSLLGSHGHPPSYHSVVDYQPTLPKQERAAWGFGGDEHGCLVRLCGCHL